jgi:iron complex outermembrane receptor protein
VARLYYAGADIGGRNSNYEDDTQRYLVGIKGTNYGWEWDAGAMYIRNDGLRSARPGTSTTRTC